MVQIDKSSQRMAVSVDGVTRYTWPVSTGRSGYGTPSGVFAPQMMMAPQGVPPANVPTAPAAPVSQGKGTAPQPVQYTVVPTTVTTTPAVSQEVVTEPAKTTKSRRWFGR